MRGFHRGHHRVPASAGKMDVKEHHVGVELCDSRNRGSDVVRLADDLDVGTELGSNSRTEQAVVVHDEHARPLATSRAHARAGWTITAGRRIDSATSVPCPGTLTTSTVPPRRSMRPCTDSDSPFRSDGTAVGSKPRPRSRTNNETALGSTSAYNEITGASDHFAALRVASRAAASMAWRSSSSAQSPTVTTSTVTPCCASISLWMRRTPA